MHEESVGIQGGDRQQRQNEQAAGTDNRQLGQVAGNQDKYNFSQQKYQKPSSKTVGLQHTKVL